MTTPSAPDASPEGLDADVLIRDAVRAFATQKFEKCRDLLKIAALKDPNSFDVVLWGARVAQKSADWESLKAVSEQWLRLDPGSMEARQSLANALGQLNHRVAAAAAWAAISMDKPDDLDALRQAVRFNRSVGRKSTADGCMSKALEFIDGDDELKIYVARFLANSLDVALSRNLFDEILVRDADIVRRTFVEFLENEEIVAAAVTASAMKSTGTEYRNELLALSDALVHEAVHHESRSDFDEAFWCYSALLLLEPRDEIGRRGRDRALSTLERMVRAALARDDFETAADLSHRILSCDPDSHSALLALGDALVQKGDLSGAIILWTEIVDRDVVGTESLRRAASYFESELEFELALAIHERMGASDPDSARGSESADRFCRKLVKIGRAESSSGRMVEAARALCAVPQGSSYFDEASRRSEQVRKGLLKVLRELYRTDDLQSVVDRGLEGLVFYPDDLELNRVVARAAMKLRDYELAQKHWSRLMIDPESAGEAMLGLARSHNALKQWPECNRMAADLLLLDPANAEGLRLLEASGRRLGQNTGSGQ